MQVVDAPAELGRQRGRQGGAGALSENQPGVAQVAACGAQLTEPRGKAYGEGFRQQAHAKPNSGLGGALTYQLVG